MAARWGEVSKGARATSDDRPSTTIETIARAASARAGAPGAQGVLTKAPACQLKAACEVGRRDDAAARALQLAERKLAAAALDDYRVVANGDDRARIIRRLNAIVRNCAANGHDGARRGELLRTRLKHS